MLGPAMTLGNMPVPSVPVTRKSARSVSAASPTTPPTIRTSSRPSPEDIPTPPLTRASARSSPNSLITPVQPLKRNRDRMSTVQQKRQARPQALGTTDESNPFLDSAEATSSSALLTPPPTLKRKSTRVVPAQTPRQVHAPPTLDPDPNNPFVAKPGEIVRPRANAGIDETAATVTYVFRGSKRTYANPFMPSHLPFPPADLSVEDDEYEMPPNPKPKLLWPTKVDPSPSTPSARASKRASVRMAEVSSHASAAAGDDTDTNDDDEEEIPVRRGLLFRADSDSLPLIPPAQEQDSQSGSNGSTTETRQSPPKRRKLA